MKIYHLLIVLYVSRLLFTFFFSHNLSVCIVKMNVMNKCTHVVTRFSRNRLAHQGKLKADQHKNTG